MTFDEINAELGKMATALSAAGWSRPEALLTFRGNDKPYVYLAGFGAKSHLCACSTPSECIAAAWEYIRALPDPETQILATYSKKLADAIDYGHGNNVPAQLVDPVRRAQKATSDMMLPAPVGAA